MLEEVNAGELNSKYRTQQVFPYDRKYARPEQTDDQYSLNVLNLEGESLANSFNSRYSRHSYENNFQVGAVKRSKQSESSSQTVPEMIDEVKQTLQTPAMILPSSPSQNIQADLDQTRTEGLARSLPSSLESSVASHSQTDSLYLPSKLGGEDLERELLPIKETKASIARKRKISEMNPKDPVHCHYPKNSHHHDHDHD